VDWTLVLSLNQLFEVNLWDQPAASQCLARGLWTEGKEKKYPNTHKKERRNLVVTGVWEMDGQGGPERSKRNGMGKEWVKVW